MMTGMSSLSRCFSMRGLTLAQANMPVEPCASTGDLSAIVVAWTSLQGDIVRRCCALMTQGRRNRYANGYTGDAIKGWCCDEVLLSGRPLPISPGRPLPLYAASAKSCERDAHAL